MRILMTADAVGGVWQYSLDLARGLARHGTEILLATMGPRPSSAQREEAGQVPRLMLVESDYALEWMQDPWQEVERSKAWLCALAEKHQADLIHLNGYTHAVAGWGRPAVTVAHSCVASWWRAVHGKPTGPEWNEYRARVEAGLAAANAVVAPTRHMARCLQEEYQFQGAQVIHNFSRAARNEQGRKKPVCLAAGRLWDEAKNLRILHRAAETIDWPIEVAGPQINPQTGAAVETQLEILGSLSHAGLLQRMRDAAIFVHPALYEPFGLAVLEAARSRCCLVLSDIPPLRELWNDAAVFVDPRDPEAWASELRRLTESESLREDFGRRALDRSARYTAFESITAYQELYSALRGLNKQGGVAA